MNYEIYYDMGKGKDYTVVAIFKNQQLKERNKMTEYTITVSNGNEECRNKEGELHCEHGPAVIYSDGTKHWYLNGKRHRENGPAIISSNGNQIWYKNGERHREDGPAVTSIFGYEEWYKNDKLHRENGPAISCLHRGKRYYLNDKLHREDGPAVIYADGKEEWWINGEKINNDVKELTVKQVGDLLGYEVKIIEG